MSRKMQGLGKLQEGGNADPHFSLLDGGDMRQGEAGKISKLALRKPLLGTAAPNDGGCGPLHQSIFFHIPA